ncbi:flippase [Natrarchaeobaculum sulfurireducens]|uniref:flippase n=1 Tax=Natrarchaeobaculum sulfurireducens TaxID=2044521 RepID=UPI000E3D0F8A|nr:flippase [Natrarchaeobaculum sulfurireducens]
MSVTARIASGFKANLVAKVVEVGVNGLLILLLTRVFLTSEEYGLLYLAISIISIAIFFSQFGLAKSAARYVTEYRKTDPSKVPLIVRRSLLFNLVAIVIVSGVFVAFRQSIAAWVGEPELLTLLVLGVGFIVARTLRSYAYFLCQGFNRVSWSAGLSIVSNLGHLTFVVGFLALGYGVPGAILGYTIGYGLGAVVGLLVLYRWLAHIPTDRLADESDDDPKTTEIDRNDSSETGLTRRLLEYSLPLSITGASSIMFKRVDIVLVGAFLTPVAVAYYTLAKQLTEFVAAPASSLGFALAPTFGESKSTDDLDRAARIYETTFEHTLLFYIPAATGIVLVADPAIRHVFGPDYLGAIPIVQVLALFVVLESINKLTNGALDFLGRARHRAMSKGSAATINVGLNIALIPTIGPVGAAISTVISYAIMATVNLYLIHSELSLSVRRLVGTAFKTCTVAVGMALVVVLLLPYVSSIVSLVALVAVGVVAWLMLAVGSGMLDLRWAVSQLS